MDLPALAATLRANPNIRSKRAIDVTCAGLGLTAASAGRPGDDAAALPDGDGWLLFAAEGFMNEFVNAAPWFAGWCAVMVNVSDILAMGGRPLAVTDAVWAPDGAAAAEILAGMKAASEAYGVPIVGGHSNLDTDRRQLAAAIIGRAKALITSFDAQPGDVLIAAVDLRGDYAEGSDNFPAFMNAPHSRLRGDMAILPELAEAGLAHAGKDISQGGIAGTAVMLAECSGVGIEIDVTALPKPDGADVARWMATFPSFGFLLVARREDATAVVEKFTRRGVAAALAGRVTAGTQVVLRDGDACEVFWDHAANPYLGLVRKEPANA
ncbi:sll0787 family AIR synthase-like protein [Algicella marina]|uniref:Sll0787 family AIR synthase-like protein n=1 Tax=Algicella marina TaxID=2683284 RepID=A0A6P1T7K9_9RHOB|nr:sll0787 family AIR synthase-like protein [Algicella marina]QHQ37279.1 sll0787 family AIR synthase-like protein [Algicella marina]